MKCLLCESENTTHFKVEKKPPRTYFHCGTCDLIFMNPQERPTSHEEKARYDYHQNQSSEGYQAFLEPLVKEIDSYFSSAGLPAETLTVLDYGCGPTAFLSSLFRQKGYRTAEYDLYYFPDEKPLQSTYHAVTSTEVWEHLFQPRQQIKRQFEILKPGGVLGVMTSAHRGTSTFYDWHYRRDLTHVVFFSEKSMQWLAQHLNLRIMKAQSPYWIFQKM